MEVLWTASQHGIVSLDAEGVNFTKAYGVTVFGAMHMPATLMLGDKGITYRTLTIAIISSTLNSVAGTTLSIGSRGSSSSIQAASDMGINRLQCLIRPPLSLSCLRSFGVSPHDLPR